MTKELEKKVNQAIKLLQSIPQDKGQITLAYSGGKDSDVCLELCKMAGIPFKAVYHSTTIDPPGTIRHVEENGVEISRPKDTFFKLMQKNGYPSRFARYCCRLLKERYDSDIVIQGIRASESKARADRYKEPEQCRVFDKKHKSRVYMPILFWTDDDVSEFVNERGVKCHALYYSGGGYFDASKRLGCVGCPLQSVKKRIEAFRENPKFMRLYIKNAQVWYDAHSGTDKPRKYTNAIDHFVATLFYDNYDKFMEATYTTFGRTDWRKYLEEYFKINLSDIPYNIE